MWSVRVRDAPLAKNDHSYHPKEAEALIYYAY